MSIERVAVAFGLVASFPLSQALASEDCPASAVRYAASSNRVYITGPVTCTLTDLDPIVSHAVLERVSKSRMIWLFRASVHLQHGATLRLRGESAGGDVNELRLKSNDSAEPGSVVYIRADWGAIEIDHVRIVSHDEATGVPDRDPDRHGRAYIHVASRLDADGVTGRESRMDIHLGDLSFLGYDGPGAAGVTWKAGGPGNKVRVRGDVIESRFHDNHVGAYVVGGEGMRWHGNLIDANASHGLKAHDARGFVLIDNDLQYNGKHGFACFDGCDGLELRDNRAASNRGGGLVFRNCAGPSVLENNEARFSGEAGLSLVDCSGNVVRFNNLDDNHRGVRLSAGSSDNLLELNRMERNQTAIALDRGTRAPVSGDGRPRRNTISRTNAHGNQRNVTIHQADENELIRNGFAASGDPQSFLLQDGVANVFAANLIPFDSTPVPGFHTKTKRGSDASTFITQDGGFPQALTPMLIDVSGAGATTTFVEATGLIHLAEGGTDASVVTATESTLTLGAIAPTVVHPLSLWVKPTGGTVHVVPASATAWQTRSTGGTVAVGYRVGKLLPSRTYEVRRDGLLLRQLTSSAAGELAFEDPAGTTPAAYTVALP
jgi:parallel beta-helix repeat protein